MSQKDLIQLEGIATKVLGYGIVEIECEDNVIIKGALCGRMKNRKIKVMIGDRVQVRVSPYDTSHGLITWRFR